MTEKSSIVPMMRQVYSQSWRCLLWMGEIPSDVGLTHAKSLFELFSYSASIAQKEAAVPPGRRHLIKNDTAKILASRESLAGPMRAMKFLLDDNNAWLSRIWTVQEAALPRHAVLTWGPLVTEWQPLCQATHVWRRFESVQAAVNRLSQEFGDQLLSFMAVVVWLNNAKRSPDPLQNMWKWRGRQATDPRDKVYALIGLFNPGTLPRSERCDYTLSEAEVYRDMTLDLIEKYQSLLPLIGDLRWEGRPVPNGMPRWTLDIRQSPVYGTEVFHLNDESNRFRADRERKLEFQSEKNVLYLKGILVDTVDWVGAGMRVTTRDVPDDLLFSTLQQWEDKAEEQAFCRLIINDMSKYEDVHPDKRATEADVRRVLNLLRNRRDQYVRLAIVTTVRNQAFFTTKSGLIGRGHLDVKAGDEVWVFNGGRVPFIVRPRETEDPVEHDFVGHSYVHGIMDGEAYPEGIEGRFIKIH